MTTQLDQLEQTLKALWSACQPNSIVWSIKIHEVVCQLFDRNEENCVQSLRLLFGLLDDLDWECSIGQLQALAPGLVFFSDIGEPVGASNSGLVRRQVGESGFMITSIIEPERCITIEGGTVDQPKVTCHNPDGSQWTLTIPAERWLVLLDWLDQWLPREER